MTMVILLYYLNIFVWLQKSCSAKHSLALHVDPSNSIYRSCDVYLKAPYSSKIRHFIIQERLNELIYGINMIIKCGI